MAATFRYARARRVAAILAAAGAAVASMPASARADTASDTAQFSVTAGSLAFTAAPDMPDLPAVTLNGQAQADIARMSDFTVADATGTGSGWRVTVSGDGSAGRSPVFAQYCPVASCGTDSGPGYVPGGWALPPNSLTLDSTGASFAPQGGTTGAPPAHGCDSGCFVDAAPGSPVKVASAGAGTGMGTFAATGYGASSLSLALPSTLRALQANEVYRVDLLWTLQSGP